MRYLSFVAICICFGGFAIAQQEKQEVILKQEGQEKIKQLSSSLKSTLVKSISQDGLHAAIEVCHEQAPKIAKSLSKDAWHVGRTSLKTRNAANAPDEWEQSTLLKFEKAMKNGVSPEILVASKMDDKQFRLMMPIPTGQACLACHGSSVDPDLLKTIQQRYPKDRAVGFELGELRGAFTLSKELDEQ